MLKPAQAGIRRGPAILVFAEARDGAVVNDFSFRIAPAAIDDLIEGDFVDIACDDAVDELRSVAAGDVIFEERRDVDERDGIADGVVFVLMSHLINADGIVARPFAIAQAFAQRQGAFMKGSSDRHDFLVVNATEIVA